MLLFHWSSQAYCVNCTELDLECSFQFGWIFIWVVLFNNENMLSTSQFIYLDNPFILNGYNDGNEYNNWCISYTKWSLRIYPFLWFLFHTSMANIFWVITIIFDHFFMCHTVLYIYYVYLLNISFHLYFISSKYSNTVWHGHYICAKLL